MKGHPKEGPKGPQMKEVNALIAAMKQGTAEEALVAALGPPDERSAYEDDDCDYNLCWQDPYRPNTTYVFAIKKGVIYYRTTVTRVPST